MRIYETTFVINPQTDDATIDKYVKDVQNIITSTNGNILHENHMGTRRLAYEIKGLTQGYYATFLYEAPSAVLPKLDHHFKINEAYIRDLTIRIECDPEEVIKQTDPFGKHGSDKREHHDNERSDAEPKKEMKDVPEEKAAVEETPAEDSSEEPAEETVDEEESSVEDDTSDDDREEEL